MEGVPEEDILEKKIPLNCYNATGKFDKSVTFLSPSPLLSE